jgi:hypothetical protein
MKLTAMIFLSVDGVYQGPGGPDEDRRGGFDRGGWIAPFAHEETWRFITSVYERADALLLGHAPGRSGSRTGRVFLKGQRDLYRYLHDETLRSPKRCSP